MKAVLENSNHLWKVLLQENHSVQKLSFFGISMEER